MNLKKLIPILILLLPGILYFILWGYLIAPLFPLQEYLRDRLFHLLKQAFLTRRVPADAGDLKILTEAARLVIHASLITWIAVLVFSI